MLVGPDELAVVADHKHSMYNRIERVDELKALPLEQLQTLAQDMFNSFLKA